MFDKEASKDFDDVLKLVGSEHKYQRVLLYFILCPITAISAFVMMNNIFLLDIPDHWCHVPGRPDDTDLATWKSKTIPK